MNKREILETLAVAGVLGAMSELRVFGDVAIAVGRFLVLDMDTGIQDPGYYLIVLRKDAAVAGRIDRDIDTPSPDGLELRPNH